MNNAANTEAPTNTETDDARVDHVPGAPAKFEGMAKLNDEDDEDEEFACFSGVQL
jgi:hypothetical protein